MFFLINFLILIISILLEVNLIYHFQVKEYRFDRLYSAIKEQGLMYFLVPKKILLPKRSRRNYTIFEIVTILLTGTFTFCVLKDSICVFILPVTSILYTILGVSITEQISQRKRLDVINKATEKIRATKTKVIGITGSFGKSSTKEFIHKVLSTKYRTGKTQGNYNTLIGISMSINDLLEDDTEYFVIEMGAYKMGEIEKITERFKPNYGVITGLSNQHISLFGSKENLIKAKSELAEALPENSTLYLNADYAGSESILNKYKNKLKIITYSETNKNSSIYIGSYTPHNGMCEFFVSINNEKINFKTGLKGKHNIVNLLPAIGLAKKLGISNKEIGEIISNLTNEKGKLSEHKGKGYSTIILDNYSSNVEGFLAAIDLLNTYEKEKKYIFTKGIIELGTEKESSYKRICEKLSANDIVLVTSDKDFKKVLRQNIKIVRDEKEFAEEVKTHRDKDSIILIEGRFSDKFIQDLELD